MNQNILIKGKIKVDQYIKGKFYKTFEFENLITSKGIDYLRKYIGGQYGPINKLGLGNNNTPASVLDTSLKNRVILLDINGKDYNSTTNSINFLVTVPEGSFPNTVSYYEAGLIYKSLTEEILITRVVFPNIIYQTTDSSLSISYSLKINGG